MPASDNFVKTCSAAKLPLTLDITAETGVTVSRLSPAPNRNWPAAAPVVMSMPPDVRIGAVLFMVCRENAPVASE